ncbi:pancreatic triacylglycerol lipase-like [Oppia nitens]|uniref:pancreatic triacylglycerol lipase-like n=1 Tax=Oppia nitens TaxID=1686743 RepID=UPI0023D9F3C4|nr:pancreatic triacylglycerol lipase-like [Oppia nitens]
MNPIAANVSFILYTNESTDGQVFSWKNDSIYNEIYDAKFFPDKKIVFIIHGYTDCFRDCYIGDHIRSDWMANMKDYFLNYNYNVIIVDWREAAKSKLYFNSAFNTQIVGALVAEFIRTLIGYFDVSPEDFHLIGHSLGAHVCGFAGKRFNETKIGQITALDPAGPGFYTYSLNKNDATLVKVIHTSAGVLKSVDNYIGENLFESIQFFGFLGNGNSLGHLDFWPNAGNGQPGCGKSFSNLFVFELKSIRKKVVCDHSRATILPLFGHLHDNKDTNECQMIGYLCNSNKDFIDGNCGDCGDDNSWCMPMEFMPEFWSKSDNWIKISNKKSNDYYIRTSDKRPFCLYHYQIVISISQLSTVGFLLTKIELTGDKSIKIDYNRALTRYSRGKNFTYLYTDTEPLGQINEVTVHTIKQNIVGFIHRVNLFSRKNPNITDVVLIDAIYVNYMSNIDKKIRDQYSSRFKPVNQTTINNNNDFLLFRIDDETIYQNQTISLNQTETVSLNQTQIVSLNQTQTVGPNQTQTIGFNKTQTVSLNQTQTVGPNQTQTIGLNKTQTSNITQTKHLIQTKTNQTRNLILNWFY